ncbi:MAG: CoA transferase [Ilumatobacteraceae bacterium]|nr:CoA transferase [Ilumatobacteraceae bacterium]
MGEPSETAIQDTATQDTAAQEAAKPAIGGRELTAVRVIDLSTGIAGAYCAKMFADAGAEVVLVEASGGAPLRRWSNAGGRTEGTDGALFRYLRHGQRSAVVEGEALTALLADADLVITDASSPVDPIEVRRRHPSAVVVSITPFGLHGPAAGRPASELIVQAESGALAIRGRADRAPLQAGGQTTDWVSGAYAAVGGFAALRGAARNGEGELVDVSWAEVANNTCTLFTDTSDAVAGRPDLTGAPPIRSYETPSVEPTLDGWVGFNTNARQQFDDFLVLIERGDLLGDPTWHAVQTRTAHWDEWNDIVRSWTTQHTTDEIVELAALMRIPVSPVSDAPTLLANEHCVARGVFIPDPLGEFQIPRRPWTIDGEPAPAPTPAPAVGADTDAIEPRAGRIADTGVAGAVAPGRPFEGLRVLDITAWWAGPSAGHVFAMLGADVIHVESTKRPDGIRMAGGAFFTRDRWWELSSFFLAVNTNKRDLTLDLSVPAGRDLLLRLVADADIVIENFTPRVFDSFGLGWDAIHAANPRAIMVRMPAFGLEGPWRDRPGFAQTMEQMTGLAWMTGFVDDQPRIQRGPCDPNGGMHAAFAAMVALVRRERTGLGSLIETPMFEAAIAVAAEPIVEYTAYGNVIGRDGNRSARAVPQGVYECATTEDWLAISVLDDTQWAALVGLLGSASWAHDADLDTVAGRSARHDELDAHLGDWARTQQLGDVVQRLIEAGVAAAPAVNPRRAHLNPQFVARGYFEVVDHPVAGTMEVPSLPFRFAGVDRWVTGPAPLMGEHNAELLAEIGCTADEIEALTAAGVIGTAPKF